MAKELSPLEQILVDTVKKSTEATGEVFDGAKKMTGQAIDFASSQIPDVIHQLLIYELADATLMLILALVAIGLWLKGFFTLKNKYDRKVKEVGEEYSHRVDETPHYLMAGLGAVFIALPATIIAVASATKILKIALAPKIYLIEYVANLIK